jgi:hypothetical protein
MSSPLDVSGTEKPRQIQENLMAYMRLFAGLCDFKQLLATKKGITWPIV